MNRFSLTMRFSDSFSLMQILYLSGVPVFSTVQNSMNLSWSNTWPIFR